MAYHKGLHLCLEAQVSCGCPGDDNIDSPPPTDDLLINRPKIKDSLFSVKAKLALYPLGEKDYLPIIAEAFRMAETSNLNPRIIHYATRIDGPVLTVFDYLESVSSMAIQKVGHHSLHFTISVGSPTKE
jgi:uncharacterized protein YqgV (UPF0045/DUF77 family)